MAGVIDRLVIELAVDPRKAGEGRKAAIEDLQRVGKEADRQAKVMEGAALKSEFGFSRAAGAAAGFGMALVGMASMRQFVLDQVQGQAALARTGDLLGISTRQIESWGGAMKATGGTQDQFLASAQAMQAGIAAFRQGMGGQEVVGGLAQLGAMDARGVVNLERLADGLKKIKDTRGAQESLAFAGKLGINEQTWRLLAQGSEKVAALRAEFYALSAATKQAGEDAQKLEKDWALLSASGKSLGDTVGASLKSALLDAIGGLKGVLDVPAYNPAETPEQRGFIGSIFRLIARLRGDIKDPAKPSMPGSEFPGGHTGANPAAPRGVRNNNPTNIMYGDFARSMGAVGKDRDGFAVFASMAKGVAAADELILRKIKGGGKDTLGTLLPSWAPAGHGANDPEAYIASVSKKLGMAPGQKIEPTRQMVEAIRNQVIPIEVGGRWAQTVAAQAAGTSASQSVTNAPTTNTSTTTVHVGGVTIHAPGADGEGIGRAFDDKLRRDMFSVGAMGGGH